MEVNSSSALSVIPWRNEDSLEGDTVHKISDKAQPILQGLRLFSYS